jgi:hypothetical protein
MCPGSREGHCHDASVRISKDAADYQYAPPPERARRAARLLRIAIGGFGAMAGVVVVLQTLHVI